MKKPTSKTTVIIFHGLEGSSTENWFPWLKNKLEKQGHKVIVPDLPHAKHPQYSEWEEVALALIFAEEEVVLIGHSLGGTLILNLMHEKPEVAKYIKHAILIAPPLHDLGWPNLKTFFDTKCDYPSITFNKILFKFSRDDPHVSIPPLTDLPLHSSLLILDGFGHFKQKEFPLITKFINL